MSPDSITLQPPSIELKGPFCALTAELHSSGEPYLGAARNVTPDTFEAHLEYLQKAKAGIGLRPGIVPVSTFWAVSDGEVLGVIKLRHRLTERLLHEGGHIGFFVRPTARRRGIATRILALVLEPARALGIERALVTCDADNLGSARVIEKNGGQLENQITSMFSGKAIRRYWIDL